MPLVLFCNLCFLRYVFCRSRGNRLPHFPTPGPTMVGVSRNYINCISRNTDPEFSSLQNKRNLYQKMPFCEIKSRSGRRRDVLSTTPWFPSSFFLTIPIYFRGPVNYNRRISRPRNRCQETHQPAEPGTTNPFAPGGHVQSWSGHTISRRGGCMVGCSERTRRYAPTSCDQVMIKFFRKFHK